MWGLIATIPLVFVTSVDDEDERQAYVDAVELFHADQDEVRVELVPYRWSGYGVHDAYTRMLALGDPTVDVLLVDVPWIPEFAWPGWLLPLDDALGDEVGAFPASVVEGGRFGGHLYGLPLSLKGNALYYRADWLEEAGLEPPGTLGELGEAAAALADRAEIPIALHRTYLYNDLLPMLWASGGGVERHGLPTVDHPQNVLALQEVAAWRDAGLIPAEPHWVTDYKAPEDAFADGRVAFLISWSTFWDRAQKQGFDGELGLAPVPGVGEGPGSSNVGSWYVAVNAHSRHPEAAAAFVRHMTSASVQRLLLERLGEVPSRTELITDPALQAAHPQLAALREVLPRGRVRPRVPNEREIGSILEESFHRILTGRQTPEVALDAAAREIEAAWIREPMPAEDPVEVLQDLGSGRAGWWWPLTVGALSGVVLLAAGASGGRRWGRGSLPRRLAWWGSIAVLGVALLQGSLALALVLREQLRELDDERRFYREQLVDRALRLGRDLSLAASVVSDVDPTGQGRVELLMASHFSEDLAYLEILDLDGSVLHTAEDALLTVSPSPPHPPDPVAVRRRSVLLQERPGDAQPILEVVAPVFSHGVHAGAVRAGISQGRYLAQLATTQRRHDAAVRRFVLGALVLTLLVTALAVLATVRFARRLTAPIVALTGHARSIRRGDLSVDIAVEGEDEVGQLARTLREMVRGLRDRDRIKDAFGRYLSPELADRFLDDPDALRLGGQLQTVTILMSDLRGFTDLSARLGPERTVHLLNRYLGAMTDVILEHGGTIDEFLGDAILVLFGAPFPDDDDALRAVTCAVRMQQSMVALNAEHEALGLPALEMGIGLCTGRVVAGNIGSAQRVKYGVVGTPVNLAARIEGLTVGTQVLADRATVEAAGCTGISEGMEVEVKGHDAPLEVVEVHGLGPDDRVPVPAEARSRAVDWPVEVHAVQDKRVEPTGQTGTIVRTSGRRVAVRVPARLHPFSTVVLTIGWPDGASGALYGRVVRREGDHDLVEITSGSAPDRARLAPD